MSFGKYDRDYFLNMERTYGSFDSLRARRLMGMMEGFLKDKVDVIVDAGCGSGHYLPFLAGFCRKLYGLEYSEDGVGMSKARKIKNLEVVKHDLAERMPLEDSSVDFLLCTEVLEHISDVGFVLGEFRRVLRPGGRALISVPNFTPLSFEHLRETFFTKDPTHVHRKSRKEWEGIVSSFIPTERRLTSSFHTSFILHGLGVSSNFVLKTEDFLNTIPFIGDLGRENIFLLKRPPEA